MPASPPEGQCVWFLESLARLFSLMDPNSPERVAFVSRALKWSGGGSGRLGHPRLHQLLALTLWRGGCAVGVGLPQAPLTPLRTMGLLGHSGRGLPGLASCPLCHCQAPVPPSPSLLSGMCLPRPAPGGGAHFPVLVPLPCSVPCGCCVGAEFWPMAQAHLCVYLCAGHSFTRTRPLSRVASSGQPGVPSPVGTYGWGQGAASQAPVGQAGTCGGDPGCPRRHVVSFHQVSGELAQCRSRAPGGPCLTVQPVQTGHGGAAQLGLSSGGTCCPGWVMVGGRAAQQVRWGCKRRQIFNFVKCCIYFLEGGEGREGNIK